MRILGHVHTFNDEEVIVRSLRALAEQSLPLDEILVVDNASTDGTLDREFPESVTVLRHQENLGTSGAVISGMKYALERGFDWIWIFDADSAPRPEALCELIRFYHGLPEAEQERIQNLASVAPVTPKRRPFHGIRFTPSGYTPVEARGVDQPVACDAVIWSGSLYRVEVIRQLGLPSADYVLDWGEFEYGYRGTVRGFHTYLVPASLFDHDIGESAAMYYTSHGLGPMRFKLLMLPPIRIYYLVRNEIFFWLRAYPTSSWIISFRIMKRRAWIVGYAMKLVLARRWRSLSALLRGVRDGVGGKMTRRF